MMSIGNCALTDAIHTSPRVKLGSPEKWGKTGYVTITSIIGGSYTKPKTEAELDFEWRQAREKDVFGASKVLLAEFSKASAEPKYGGPKFPDTLYPSDVESKLRAYSGVDGWKAELVGSQFVIDIPKRPKHSQFTVLVVK